MHNDFITTVAILVAICFLIFIIISTTNIKKEGFGSSSNKNSNSKNSSSNSKSTSSSSSSIFSSSSSNGIAGNSESYIAGIQSSVIKMQDTMLLSKYRTEYENTIMALDDLVNNLMLQTALSINTSSPQQGLSELVTLHNAKSALNEVMKFIDGSSS